MSSPSVDVILERLSRIDCEARICFRPDFYRHNKDHGGRWYLNMGRVIQTRGGVGFGRGYSNIVFGHDGPTPEDAVRNGWEQILRDMKNPSAWFIRYYGAKDGMDIMQSERLMWVRWNESIQDWESPSREMLADVPEDRVKIYHPGYPDRNYC